MAEEFSVSGGPTLRIIRFPFPCITPGIAKHLPKINFSSLRTPQEAIRCLCFTEIKTTALTNPMASVYPAMRSTATLRPGKLILIEIYRHIFFHGAVYCNQLLVCLKMSRLQLESHFQPSPEIPHFSLASEEPFLSSPSLDCSEGHLHCRTQQPLGLLFD